MKIKFISNDETKELTVSNCYAYIYEGGKGKEVLRLSILETDHTFDEIAALKTADREIQLIENDEVKNTYTGYNADFICSYSGDTYTIELRRVSDSDLKIAELEEEKEQLKSEAAELREQLNETQLALIEIYEAMGV